MNNINCIYSIYIKPKYMHLQRTVLTARLIVLLLMAMLFRPVSASCSADTSQRLKNIPTTPVVVTPGQSAGDNFKKTLLTQTNEPLSFEMVVLLAVIELIFCWKIISKVRNRRNRLGLIALRLLATYELVSFLMNEPWHYCQPVIFEILVLLTMKVMENTSDEDPTT